MEWENVNGLLNQGHYFQWVKRRARPLSWLALPQAGSGAQAWLCGGGVGKVVPLDAL